MFLLRHRKEAELIPKGWGLCWRNYDLDNSTIAPIPLNWMISFLRLMWHKSICPSWWGKYPPDWHTRICKLKDEYYKDSSKEYTRGFSEGVIAEGKLQRQYANDFEKAKVWKMSDTDFYIWKSRWEHGNPINKGGI